MTGQGKAYCTDLPNQIAIQVSDLKCGLIPLPISQWSQQISDGCARSGIGLSWSEKDGDIVAIVDLPQQILDIEDRRISITGIELNENEIVLSGNSEPLSGRFRTSNRQGSDNDSPNSVK